MRDVGGRVEAVCREEVLCRVKNPFARVTAAHNLAIARRGVGVRRAIPRAEGAIENKGAGPSGWAACGRSDDPMRGCHDRLTPCLGFHARACGCCPEGSMVHFGVETGTCASTPRAAARCRGVPSESHRTDRCGNKPRSQFTPGGGCAEYSLAKAVDPVEALLIDVPQRPLPEHGLDVQQNVDVHEAPSHWILR